LGGLGCQVIEARHFSKLLGTPFGISLDIEDVDEFFFQKIEKKLRCWSSLFLSLLGRAIIANSILLSILWYFIHIWARSDVVIRQIKGSIRNYVWSGTEAWTQARVNWDNCCAMKSHGGIGLIDPDEALTTLTNKWIVRAMDPGTSTLHILLRHRLGKLRPTRTGTWPPTMHWALIHGFSAPKGSRIWNQLMKSWQVMNKFLQAIPPRNKNKVLQVNLWWTMHFIGGNFGYSLVRVGQLSRKGLRNVGQLWNSHTRSLGTIKIRVPPFGHTN
jgi:hypothetical protein